VPWKVSQRSGRNTNEPKDNNREGGGGDNMRTRLEYEIELLVQRSELSQLGEEKIRGRLDIYRRQGVLGRGQSTDSYVGGG